LGFRSSRPGEALSELLETSAGFDHFAV
jgi:hypothetical protein